MTIGVMLALTHINSDTGASQLFWPLIWRGFGTVMMFIPLSMATLGSLPKQDISSGSGFFSLTRQLGGSIGIAAITTLVAKQQFVHRAQLIYDASDLNPAYPSRLQGNTSYLSTLTGDPVAIQNQALALIDRAINGQAALLSYRDVFYFVGFIFLGALPLVLLLSAPQKPALAR
jgi:DHA2 family multidrug resistance protein